LLLVSVFTTYSKAENGYRLWLRYERVPENVVAAQYKRHTTELVAEDREPAITAAIEELQNGLNGMLGVKIR
jgi:alpha-glucuronidase